MPSTDKALAIPKFKDKTTYYQSELGFESSYPVSASYKGILRLSPNDTASLAEVDNVQVFNDDVTNIVYKDSIENELETQFIRVSTSDGFLLDCRLGKSSVEFDNLYIIGPAQHERVILFASDEGSFTLGPTTNLPVLANKNATAMINSDTKIMKDVVANDSENLAHILVSHNLTKRVFEYEEIIETIDNAILESLLDLSTEPVGSIHFFPISIQEYEKLLLKGRPNQFYCISDGSLEKKKNPAIVRDYLLCDGSLYKNIDFPELAKILDGEKIIYWAFDASKNKYVKKTHINDYSENKFFRVPDLRRMFLRSCYPDITRAGKEGNEVGYWEVDHRPSCVKASTEDNHTHCITSSWFTGEYKTDKFEDVAEMDDGQLVLTDNAAVLAPTNGYYNWGGDKISAYGYRCPASSGNYKWPNMGYASYSLAVPQTYDYTTMNLSANSCVSSENIISAKLNPTNDSEISYNGLDEYVPYLEQTEETYGMENAPEFFCALPMIRI